MANAFEEHFARARQARADREHAIARAACEAALSVAVMPYERALALDGLADTYSVDQDSHRALELLDQAIVACLPSPDHDTPDDVNAAYALALALFDKAELLMLTRREREGLATIEELLGRLLDRVTKHSSKSERDLELCIIVVRGLRWKAGEFSNRDQLEESIACYDDLIRRFGAAEDDRLLRHVARAMYWRARLLGDIGRQDKEVEGYDEMITRFGNSRNEHIIEAVLESFELKTRIYQDQEDLEMIVETCDDIIRRFGGDSDWHVANYVARAMIRRAVALGKKGQHGKELAGYDAVLLRYADSPEELLRQHAAKALMFKAVSLNDADLQRHEPWRHRRGCR